MSKSIRVKLSQQLANYRKPASFLIKESYPLAPYSSVIGMIHFACDFKEYHPMKLCIQGEYGSDVADLAVLYNFGIKYNASRHQGKVKAANKGYDGINRGVRNIHLLTDVEMTIYIMPDNSDDFEIIMRGLENPKYYLSLGRHEDIVRINEVKAVELVEYDEEFEPKVVNNMYVPVDQLERGYGTVYNLNKVFHINSKTNIREWEKPIKARYISKGSSIRLKENCGMIDEEQNSTVCFA